MAKKGVKPDTPPKRAVPAADLVALREYGKMVMTSGWSPAGKWRQQPKRQRGSTNAQS